MLKYKDKTVIELAGHDHWEDLRAYQDKDGNEYRNIFVAAGISLDHSQLPAFNTMKIDAATQQPKELVETILDITKAYGKDPAPQLEELPKMTYSYQDDFGIYYLTPSEIIQRMHNAQIDIEGTLHYLSDKLGFDHNDPEMYEKGLQLATSWSLVSNKKHHVENFLCQSTRGRTKVKMVCYLPDSTRIKDVLPVEWIKASVFTTVIH